MAIAARMPIIATTTSSSINVNPALDPLVIFSDERMASPASGAFVQEGCEATGAPARRPRHAHSGRAAMTVGVAVLPPGPTFVTLARLSRRHGIHGKGTR